jgi:hypothetical protein
MRRSHIFKVKKTDESFQHLDIIWLRYKIPEQSLVKSGASLQERRQTPRVRDLWRKIGIDELVFLKECEARLGFGVEESSAGQDELFPRFGLGESDGVYVGLRQRSMGCR